MNDKLNHLRNLIYLGKADHHFDSDEKKFIFRIADRLGVGRNEIEAEMNSLSTDSERPALPTGEIQRFILLDDLLNLMAADRKIREEEVALCKTIAREMGFDDGIVNVIVNKIEKHLDEGFSENKTALLIKNELFKNTAKNYHHEKHN